MPPAAKLAARKGKSGKPRGLPPASAARPTPSAGKKPKPKKSPKPLRVGAKRAARPVRGQMSNLQLDVPVPFFSGQALAHRGIIRDNQSLAANRRFMYFVTNTGQSSTVAVGLGWTVAQAGAVAAFTYNVPLLTQADDAGGPTAGRAQKALVDLHVTTAMLSRGSAYYVGEFNTRLSFAADPTTLTGVQADALFVELTSSPMCLTKDTARDSRLIMPCNVVDANEYNSFQEWHGTRNAVEMFRHIGIWPNAVPLPRPMSTILVAFEAPANAQSITMTFGARFYCRHPVNTIPGRLMSDITVASQSAVNAATAPNGFHSPSNLGGIM